MVAHQCSRRPVLHFTAMAWFGLPRLLLSRNKTVCHNKLIFFTAKSQNPRKLNTNARTRSPGREGLLKRSLTRKKRVHAISAKRAHALSLSLPLSAARRSYAKALPSVSHSSSVASKGSVCTMRSVCESRGFSRGYLWLSHGTRFSKIMTLVRAS